MKTEEQIEGFSLIELCRELIRISKDINSKKSSVDHAKTIAQDEEDFLSEERYNILKEEHNNLWYKNKLIEWISTRLKRLDIYSTVSLTVDGTNINLKYNYDHDTLNASWK